MSIITEHEWQENRGKLFKYHIKRGFCHVYPTALKKYDWVGKKTLFRLKTVSSHWNRTSKNQTNSSQYFLNIWAICNALHKKIQTNGWNFRNPFCSACKLVTLMMFVTVQLLWCSCSTCNYFIIRPGGNLIVVHDMYRATNILKPKSRGQPFRVFHIVNNNGNIVMVQKIENLVATLLVRNVNRLRRT